MLTIVIAIWITGIISVLAGIRVGKKMARSEDTERSYIMEILIKGDQKIIDKIMDKAKIFKCRTCGCVFKASYGQYLEARTQWEVTEARCPQCDRLAVVHDLAPNELAIISEKGGESDAEN